MIQNIGCTGRKIEQATFILFTPKWTQVKSVTKVEQHFTKHIKAVNINSLFFNSNRPKVGLKKIVLI